MDGLDVHHFAASDRAAAASLERARHSAPKCFAEGAVIKQGVGSGAVANALRSGDVDALLELADLLEASGAEENARSFVLQVICELLPEDRQDSLLTGQQAERRGNVIDFLRRKQQD